MSGNGDELVLVVPRARVIRGAGWRGVLRPGAGSCLATMREHGRWESRTAMEKDPRFKQIIPYLVLRDRGAYFLMRRTRAGGDARLHGRFSIGVGGHVNPADRDLAGGLAREWAEEIEADFVPEFSLLGLLNDDETEVGRVHLGVVYLAEAAGRPVRVREVAKLEGRFAGLAAVAAVYDQMETWSQLVFDFLAEGRQGPAAPPSPVPRQPGAGPLS
jgi:predicted NUDIX family phosphoesterase